MTPSAPQLFLLSLIVGIICTVIVAVQSWPKFWNAHGFSDGVPWIIVCFILTGAIAVQMMMAVACVQLMLQTP